MDATTLYTPIHLQPYTRPKHYFGETWEGWYPVCGVTRDSGCIERSNFRVIESALKALPEVEVGDEPGVQVTRCAHFLCGWVDTLYVHETAAAALELADHLVGRIEHYSILDESDCSELEYEEALACWQAFGTRDRVECCRRFGVSIFAARRGDLPCNPRGECLISYLAR